MTVAADGGTEIRITGSLTFDTVPALYESTSLDLSGPRVIVNLGEVSRADSAGLSLMLEWTRMARAARVAIEFTQVPAQLHSLIEVSGLSRLLTAETR